MSLKHITTVFLKIVYVTWQRHLEYRGAALIWILNGFIMPTVLTIVWLTIRKYQELPLDSREIITYYFLSTISIRLTQSWTGERLGMQIKDGILSQYLTRPLPYWIHQLGLDIAIKIVRLIALLPFVLLFLLIFSDSMALSTKPLYWLLAALAILTGFSINFILQNIIGLGALWVEHIYGLNTIFQTLEALFGGVTIPFALMPAALAFLSQVLPFRYLVGFPIELVMGTLSNDAIIKGFFIMATWIPILLVIYKLVYAFGIKKFTAVGI